MYIYIFARIRACTHTHTYIHLCTGLHALLVLDLSQCTGISGEDLQPLSTLSALQRLDLSGIRLSSRCTFFFGFDKLVSLRLANTSIRGRLRVYVYVCVCVCTCVCVRCMSFLYSSPVHSCSLELSNSRTLAHLRTNVKTYERTNVRTYERTHTHTHTRTRTRTHTCTHVHR
jgi:hypothetical protein